MPYIEQTRIFFTRGCFVESLLSIDLLVWEKTKREPLLTKQIKL